MSVLEYSKKEKRGWNKNFFFVGTVLVFALNCIVYFFFNEATIFRTANNWRARLDFRNLVNHFISAFQHSNLQHLLLNGLCFLIAGGYVERKNGSVGLLVLVFVFALFGESMVAANHTGTGGRGFSGVNYCFYAYIIVDFAFAFREIKKDKKEFTVSLTVLGLIYLACCFCGGTESFAFKVYPYDLINNLGHYTAFLAGLLLSLLFKLCQRTKVNI